MFSFTKKISFNILICVERDGDRFYAHCPSLKGLHVDGETHEQALENVKTATILYIKSLIKHGDPIPLQIVPQKELNDHCSVRAGTNVLNGYPHQELVQVPV